MDCPAEWLQQLKASGGFAGIQGIVIGEAVPSDQGYCIGKAGKALSLQQIRSVRELAGNDFTIIATAGVHEPMDALDLLSAGAAYIQLHSGLVYAGPGLPKRINEAIIHERIHADDARALPKPPSF